MENVFNYSGGSGIFIQIGAGAGDMDSRASYRDGFTEFIKRLPRNRVKKIILVEPNPINIPLLRECWKDYPEAIIYETAIVPTYEECNNINFYYCPDDGPHYQVASINKQHVEKHYVNGTIDVFSVTTKHLENFINEIVNEQIELLVLDIEGIDAEVLLDVNFNNISVKYLSFEYIHLNHNAEKVFNYLNDNNFKFLGKGVDYNGFDYLYERI